MSPSQFEKINGHFPTVGKIPGAVLGYKAGCLCDCSGESVAMWVVDRTEQGALKALLRDVLSKHGRIVFGHARWECEECGSGGVPLQADHIHPRSHGRDDRVSNLSAKCELCHRKKTGDLQFGNIHRVDTRETE